MDSEKTNKENHDFILNEVIKRKILDMYNISKEGISPKSESENPESDNPQEQ